MNKKKIMSKIMPAIVAGSVLCSAGGFAYAQSTAKNSANTSITQTKDKDTHKHMKSKLDELVKSSTITGEQANKILDYMNQKQTEKKAEMDKIKNMTEEERKTYFENNKKEKLNLADELVSKGIVSKEQADSVVKAIRPNFPKKEHKMNTNKIKSVLDNLVKSSTITGEQENKILDYINQKQTERKADMDKVKNMTKEERKAYFENNKKEKPDFLADVVKEGIITQEQANSIKEAMPAPKDGSINKNKNSNKN